MSYFFLLVVPHFCLPCYLRVLHHGLLAVGSFLIWEGDTDHFHILIDPRTLDFHLHHAPVSPFFILILLASPSILRLAC